MLSARLVFGLLPRVLNASVRWGAFDLQTSSDLVAFGLLLYCLMTYGLVTFDSLATVLAAYDPISYSTAELYHRIAGDKKEGLDLNGKVALGLCSKPSGGH